MNDRIFQVHAVGTRKRTLPQMNLIFLALKLHTLVSLDSFSTDVCVPGDWLKNFHQSHK